MFAQMFYSGPPFEVLHEEYARKGKIDENAPVKASASISIHAPVEQVWELLINLPGWPEIDPNTSDVRLEGDIEVDTFFRFKLYNFPIRAKIAVINPPRELHWTGVSLWFKAVDLHTLEPAGNGRTRLSIAESFAGVLAIPVLSSERLKAQHEKWLVAFKREAEGGG